MRTMEIDAQLSTEDIRKLIKRYGFAESDFVRLAAFAQALQPLVNARAYYVWKQKEEPVDYEDYAVVFISLGEGVDALQEVYLEREAVTEGYMIECLASVMLSKTYGECVRQLEAERRKTAEKIDFLGDTYPLSLMEKWYSEFAGIPVTFNRQYVLTPKKSVVFLLPMAPGEAGAETVFTDAGAHICENCKNTACILREHPARESGQDKGKPGPGDGAGNYGYRRIFGNKGEK